MKPSDYEWAKRTLEIAAEAKRLRFGDAKQVQALEVLRSYTVTTCAKCEGRGRLSDSSEADGFRICPTCEGAGKRYHKRTEAAA